MRYRTALWRGSMWLPAVALGAMGGRGMLLLQASKPVGGAKGETAEAQAPRVPVIAEAAKRGDIGVYLTGLGAVTPVKTVTVRSLVDGQLMRVLYQEGQKVTRQSLLAEIDPRPFQAQLLLAEGQMRRDRALLENARRDQERYALLATQDSIARQQYDTQKSLVGQLEGTVETDQAQIDTAHLQIVYSRIAAPVSGRVGLRLVDPGNIVRTTDAGGLVTITQLQPITVVFAIAEDSVPPVLEKLHDGEHLEVDAWNRELTRKIAQGTLLTIDNQVDPNTGTVKFKALFDNANDELFPNQFVNARLLLEVERGATLVPVAAIQRGTDRTFVYVVGPNQTAEVREVKTGPAEADEVSVKSGLSVDELVVVDGADKLRSGSGVTVQTPDGGQPGPPK